MKLCDGFQKCLVTILIVVGLPFGPVMSQRLPVDLPVDLPRDLPRDSVGMSSYPSALPIEVRQVFGGCGSGRTEVNYSIRRSRTIVNPTARIGTPPLLIAKFKIETIMVNGRSIAPATFSAVGEYEVVATGNVSVDLECKQSRRGQPQSFIVRVCSNSHIPRPPSGFYAGCEGEFLSFYDGNLGHRWFSTRRDFYGDGRNLEVAE
jgi:hypothetical protein